jgi:HlyD family type I secretion membrane fusion protein
MYRRTIQHQEGGIVDEILVRDGSRVKAGDPLIVLKDVKVEAGIELVLTQLDGEVARGARLQAEQAWADKIVFPAELVSAPPPAHRGVAAREGPVHTRRDLPHGARLIRADRRPRTIARQAQIKADQSALRFQREELESNRKLLKEGFISNVRILSLERGLADVGARLSEHEADLSTARSKGSELQLKAVNLRTTMMQEAANEMRQTTVQILDLRERLRPLQDAATRQRIVAPIGGQVVGLKITTVGAVIGPRDPILDIVPENVELIVEGRVRPEDVNYVGVGAEADVRLTSFRQRITPVVAGSVIYLSADRIEDRNERAAFYVVHVRVTPAALAKAGDLKLQSGMPAELYIKTAARTALMYVLDPVSGFLQRSLREPMYEQGEPKSPPKQ